MHVHQRLLLTFVTPADGVDSLLPPTAFWAADSHAFIIVIVT
jgi:hypothetical protein